MLESRHAELAKASQAEGVSLNAFITEILSGAVGRQGYGLSARTLAPHDGGDARLSGPRRLLPSLLVVLVFQTLL